MSTKKLNEALGIDSIDDFLSDLSVDTKPIRDFENIDDKIKEKVDAIDTQIKNYQNGNVGDIRISEIGESLNEIKDLIDLSKQTIKHIAEQTIDSELIDAELVGAMSKLVEATHLTVAEYITLYRDRVAFYDKVRIEMLKHENRLHEMEIKHKYDLEKLNMTKKSEDVEVNNMKVAFTQEDIIRQMQEEERRNS